MTKGVEEERASFNGQGWLVEGCRACFASATVESATVLPCDVVSTQNTCIAPTSARNEAVLRTRVGCIRTEIQSTGYSKGAVKITDQTNHRVEELRCRLPIAVKLQRLRHTEMLFGALGRP